MCPTTQEEIDIMASAKSPAQKPHILPSFSYPLDNHIQSHSSALPRQLLACLFSYSSPLFRLLMAYLFHLKTTDN